MDKRSKLSKLLKEPLLHFLLIGVGLFFLFSQLNSEEVSSSEDPIVMNKSKMEALVDVFMKENSVVPTDKEIQKLVKDDIREEVLYREALAIGLDKEDKVIRHRLAQKMQYLFEDVAMLDEPRAEELKVFFEKNKTYFKRAKGTEALEYSKVKEHVRRAWLAEEQQKENKIFYEDLKSRYEIVLDDEVRKALDGNVVK